MASIKDYARMCKTHESDCYRNKCPLYKKNMIDCFMFVVHNTDEAEAIIDQWCAEHPQKTYLQDFTEKFPNMKPRMNIAGVKPCELYGFSRAGKLCRDYDDCAACWNEVMPEEANENSNA